MTPQERTEWNIAKYESAGEPVLYSTETGRVMPFGTRGNKASITQRLRTGALTRDAKKAAKIAKAYDAKLLAEKSAKTEERVRQQTLRQDRVNAGLPADPKKAEKTRRTNETLISFRLSPDDVQRFDELLKASAKHAGEKGRKVPTRSRIARVAVEYMLSTFTTKRDRELWLKELVAA